MYAVCLLASTSHGFTVLTHTVSKGWKADHLPPIDYDDYGTTTRNIRGKDVRVRLFFKSEGEPYELTRDRASLAVDRAIYGVAKPYGAINE